MPLDILLVCFPACFASNMAPGPSNLLSVFNSCRFGFSIASLAGADWLLAHR